MNNRYVVSREEGLSLETLRDILTTFQTLELPKYKQLQNYYEGKMAITYKQQTDVGKACNKVVVNYCNNIVNNYLGYLTGTPISYQGSNVDAILEVLNYNDVHSLDNEYLRQALIFGRAFQINYVDEYGKQRLKVLDTRECIPVYDDTLEGELLYVIRFYQEYVYDIDEDRYVVEVYSNNDVKRYYSAAGFISFSFINSYPHFYKQCPINVFSLNKDESSIFEQVMTLNDAYNALISGEVDSWDAFADAYLVLSGVEATSEDLDNMKQHRCILLDKDAKAEYLTKTLQNTQVVDMMKNIDKKIYQISNCPDFTNEEFGTASGVAIRYKLLGFENVSASIESYMRKALQRRIELIATLLKLTDEETTWRDVLIIFKRNLPIDIEENADAVSKLKGVVSKKTLLSILPFVYDVDKEYEQVQKENYEDMLIYNEMNAEEDTNNDNSADVGQEV